MIARSSVITAVASCATSVASRIHSLVRTVGPPASSSEGTPPPQQRPIRGLYDIAPVPDDFDPVVDGSVCGLSWCEIPAAEYRDGKAWCHWHVTTGDALEWLTANPVSAGLRITDFRPLPSANQRTGP